MCIRDSSIDICSSSDITTNAVRPNMILKSFLAFFILCLLSLSLIHIFKDYFLIQQYRYGGSITMDYHIESEELYGCEIHRFTLQPIIENALFHGIEPKGTAGAITVSAESGTMNGKKVLKISVTDNGIGMTRETIDSVLHEEDNPGKNKKMCIRDRHHAAG